MKGFRAARHQSGMKRSLTFLPLLSLFAACNVGHMVGENQHNQDAVTCAATVCNGKTVCVDSDCVEPTGMCGGIAGIQCQKGELCVDDPRDNCDPDKGGADCGGVCVPEPTTHQAPDSGTPAADAGSSQAPMDCGGHRPNPPMCPSGYVCVDNPKTCSMAADCPGICVPEVIKQCGGHTPNPGVCAANEICVDNPSTPSMTVDAPGICITKVFCGGIASFPCPGNLSCEDDPTDDCDPMNGGADCGGYCALPKNSFCGGIAGLQCAKGLRCLDDPADGCDPANGGSDCGGLCVP